MWLTGWSPYSFQTFPHLPATDQRLPWARDSAPLRAPPTTPVSRLAFRNLLLRPIPLIWILWTVVSRLAVARVPCSVTVLMFVEFLEISHFKNTVIFQINPFNPSFFSQTGNTFFLLIVAHFLAQPFYDSSSRCFDSPRGCKESPWLSDWAQTTDQALQWGAGIFLCVFFKIHFFLFVFIYLAVLGLLWNTEFPSSLWHVGSLLVACRI